jgi:site-specific recombinase XerD
VPRTVQHVHRTIHRMLRQAVRWQLVARNVAADIELPKATAPRMMTLDHDQARRLLEVAGGQRRARWWAMLILLAVATGCRRGELPSSSLPLLCHVDILPSEVSGSRGNSRSVSAHAGREGAAAFALPYTAGWTLLRGSIFDR